MTRKNFVSAVADPVRQIDIRLSPTFEMEWFEEVDVGYGRITGSTAACRQDR